MEDSENATASTSWPKLPVPPLPTTACTSKIKPTKKVDRARNKTNIGLAFGRWQNHWNFRGLKLDSEVATFLYPGDLVFFLIANKGKFGMLRDLFGGRVNWRARAATGGGESRRGVVAFTSKISQGVALTPFAKVKLRL